MGGDATRNGSVQHEQLREAARSEQADAVRRVCNVR
jgi:hypothetical protein